MPPRWRWRSTRSLPSVGAAVARINTISNETATGDVDTSDDVLQVYDAVSGALGSECTAVGVTPDSVPAYATCLARSAICGAAEAVTIAAPRSVATFALGGLPGGSTFCDAP